MKRLLLPVVTLLLLLTSTLSHAWWNKDWDYRKKIMLDTSPTGVAIGENLVGLTVAVRLHPGNFTYFTDIKPDGADLRFVASDDKTPLRHHIERIDTTGGIAVFWVQVPAIAPGTNEGFIWMYYGNATAENVADRAASFDTPTTLALHFVESAGFPVDGTAYAHAVTQANIKLGSAGVIDSGAEFDAKSTVRISASPVLKVVGDPGFTLAAWIKLSQSQVDGLVYTQGGDKGGRFSVGVTSNIPYIAYDAEPAKTGKDKTRETGAAPGARFMLQAATPLQEGRWYHVVVTVSDKVRLYLDGEEVVAAATPPGMSAGGSIALGATDTAAGFVGALDELTVSKLARSPNWIRTVAKGQGPDGKLITLGDDESFDTAGAAGAYLQLLWGVLAKLSLDGWVIVALIGVIGLVSADVSINKFMALKRTERADDAFLQSFNKLSGSEISTTSGEKPRPEFTHSCLHRVFRAGVAEVDALLDMAEHSGMGRILTPQALEAIRSSLDEALSEEITRLNLRLSALVVAISGAPFMGLLGTVWGVMITFASVAASGDVNVNTIAPGISAAIATTVAGLIVAIPALFVYNHLAARVGRRTTAMEVFSDRMISKLAVAYSGMRARETGSAA